MPSDKPKIRVGVGAVIVNDEGKIFLHKRGQGASINPGMWEGPGGGVEFGETMVEAIVREVKEEHGVEIEVGEMLDMVEYIDSQNGKHVIGPAFVCKIIRGTPRILEPDKCEEIGWFTREEALELPLSPIGKEDLANFHRRYPTGIV